MGFLSGIGAGFRMLAGVFDPGAERDPTNPMYWADSGNVSMSGIAVTERRASQLGAVQAVRFGLAGSISSLPLMLFRDQGAGVRTAATEHPLYQLLAKRPNQQNTPAEFIGEISWHLAYWRNAYCKIIPGADYAIGELEIIHPRRLAQIERRPDGHLYYTFNPPATLLQADQQPRAETLRDDEIWHLRGNPLTEDGLRGEPIWESAREVFGRAIAVHEYGDIWFQNSGQSGGTLEHPGDFENKVERNKFLENWREAGTGRNRHKDRLLTHNVKYTPIKVTNAEAQLLETENRSDTEIFGLWSFPPHRAARLEKSTNNNIEQQSLDFVIYALAPLGVAIQQAAERDLLLGDGAKTYCLEFNFEPLLRGDMRSQYAALMIARQGEWMSANDVLRQLGKNPRTDAGGDEYENPVTKSAPDSGDTADNQGGQGNKS